MKMQMKKEMLEALKALKEGDTSGVQTFLVDKNGKVTPVTNQEDAAPNTKFTEFETDSIFQDSDLVSGNSKYVKYGSPELVDTLKNAAMEYTKGYSDIPGCIDKMDPEYQLTPDGNGSAVLDPSNLFARSVYQSRTCTVNTLSAMEQIENGATPEERVAILSDVNMDFTKMSRMIFGDMMNTISSTLRQLLLDTFVNDEAISKYGRNIEEYLLSRQRYSDDRKIVLTRESLLNYYDITGNLNNPIATYYSLLDALSQLSAYRNHEIPGYMTGSYSEDNTAIFTNGRLIPLHTATIMNSISMDFNRTATIAYNRFKEIYGEEYARRCYNHVMTVFMDVHIFEIRRFVLSVMHEVATVALAHLSALDKANVKEPKNMNYTRNCPWTISGFRCDEDY